MALRRDNFQQVLTPIHQYLFYMQYDELPEEYSRIFEDTPMRMKEETTQREGAFGLWDENSEGSSINEDEMSEGPTITYVASRYDKGYEVTWELTKDDLYGVFSGKGKNGTSAQGLSRGLRGTIETTAADVLNNGFANTGYDGVSLFNATHPLVDSADTVSNLQTGGLSDTTLKGALIKLRQIKDEAGIKIMAIPGQLIVPPELEYTANTLIYSAGTPGNENNDKNTIPGLSIEVMDYLTSATAWFVRAKNIRNLVFKWRERPWFDTQIIQKKVDFFCYGYARWTQGYDDFRGVVGSTGV